MVATLALYNPVNRHPFVNYDDDRYVTENPHVHNGVTWDTITWAFTAMEQGNWHPLTWLSHALDYQLFHQNATGHHFTSLLIHAANAVLLFLLLMYATGRVGPSLFVAALFALHPINVESVAWVAERKNVLSTFFFFAALIAYCWYARKPDWRRYLAFAGLFVFGLMSKPMVITLPFVLLLLDYWPLGRIQGGPAGARPIAQAPLSRLLVEKLPLLVLSAASAVVTMQAQRAGGAMRSTAQFSLGVRLENAVVAYATYLWKMIWPLHLAPLYPHPGNSLAAWQVGDIRAGAAGRDCVLCLDSVQAISADRLAVVSGDSGAGHRTGASRRPGHGRPLCLHTPHWNFCDDRLGSGGPGGFASDWSELRA